MIDLNGNETDQQAEARIEKANDPAILPVDSSATILGIQQETEKGGCQD